MQRQFSLDAFGRHIEQARHFCPCHVTTRRLVELDEARSSLYQCFEFGVDDVSEFFGNGNGVLVDVVRVNARAKGERASAGDFR